MVDFAESRGTIPTTCFYGYDVTMGSAMWRLRADASSGGRFEVPESTADGGGRPTDTDARKLGREADQDQLRAADGGGAQCAGPVAADALGQSTTPVVPPAAAASSW